LLYGLQYCLLIKGRNKTNQRKKNKTNQRGKERNANKEWRESVVVGLKEVFFLQKIESTQNFGFERKNSGKKSMVQSA
jgi:hypothetical protein